MGSFVLDLCISIGVVVAVEVFIHFLLISKALLSFSTEN